MIDFHCHIDLFPNPAAVIREVQAKGTYVLAVTTTPKSWDQLQQLLSGQRRIRAAVGLHPELVAERHGEVEELCAIAARTRYVGEIGIDGSPQCKSSFELQKQVFEAILQCCSKLGGRILSIHSRRAASSVLDCLERHSAAGTAVLHWFSGTKPELERAIRMGVWFSVGPAMLASKKSRELVEAMPRARILTESDGPFATVDKCPIGPNEMFKAEQAIAEIWNTSSEESKCRIHENFKNLVSRYDA